MVLTRTNSTEAKPKPPTTGWSSLPSLRLKRIKRPVPIILHLDSSYVRNGITGWIHSWKKKGWRTADGKPVKNVELWTKLDELAGRFDIDWRWVKGHAGDLGNERADELANMGAAQFAGITGIRIHHASNLSGYGNHGP